MNIKTIKANHNIDQLYLNVVNENFMSNFNPITRTCILLHIDTVKEIENNPLIQLAVSVKEAVDSKGEDYTKVVVFIPENKAEKVL